MSMTFSELRGDYARLLATMTIRPEKLAAADAVARKIVANRPRYEAVSKATGVPWAIIGVIHAMECGLSFKQHLHNGDPLTARTRQVPAGRPKAGSPPFTWDESAIDALRYDGLDKVTDWSEERECFVLEDYNGWGYRKYHPEVLSPYLWSYSNHYLHGKYVADGEWDPSAVSGQCGAIVLLKRVRALAAAADTPPLPDHVPIEVAPAPPSTTAQKAGSAAAGAVTGAVVATSAGMQWWEIGLIGAGCGLIGLAIVLILKGRK
ncbi:hypothetical protein [Xanthobacter sp. 126]|uniref:hypothetical protein n=1 Tax=Xanthobacter sp. 126 TaxID=1131814 RepID=UPI00045EA755|nr:hypothetical protein [Xanthobacter sp. 126]